MEIKYNIERSGKLVQGRSHTEEIVQGGVNAGEKQHRGESVQGTISEGRGSIVDYHISSRQPPGTDHVCLR